MAKDFMIIVKVNQFRCVSDSQRKQLLKKWTMKTVTGSGSSCQIAGRLNHMVGQIEPHMKRAINDKKNTLRLTNL